MNNRKVLLAILLLIETLSFSKIYTLELTTIINKMIDNENN